MRRYLLFGFMVLSLLVGGIRYQSANAEDPVQATVVVAELNVRSEPAIGDNIIGQFTNGTRLDVLGKEEIWQTHDWLYVTNGVLTGWVNFESVQMDDETAYRNLPVLLNLDTIPELPITGHTNAENLRLRSDPSTSSEIITTLPNHTPLMIIGHDDHHGYKNIWLEVNVIDGSNLQGWVSCYYVILDGIRNRQSGSACINVAQVATTATVGRTQ